MQFFKSKSFIFMIIPVPKYQFFYGKKSFFIQMQDHYTQTCAPV